MNISRIKSFTAQQVDWQSASNEILAIRHKVFMIEQHFFVNSLCDSIDPECFHVNVRNKDGMVVATGRLSPQGRIGRIAVLLPYRGAGIGSEILTDLIKIARKNKLPNISLNAELDNRHFYDLQKFSANGPVYMKQGVAHQMLTKQLA